MSFSAYEQNHQKFLKHLDESETARLIVANWFMNKGYPVRLVPITRAKNHADWKSHVDPGDLEICLRIEIKKLSANFTDQNDWPYNDKFIVCAQHSYDQAQPKPYAYMYLNTHMTHAAIVMGTSFKHWYTERVHDSRYEDFSQNTYFAPLEHVKFFKL